MHRDDDDLELTDYSAGNPGIPGVLHNDVEAKLGGAQAQSLSWAEKKNIAFLFGLYTIHMLPMTFNWYSMPILLRQQLSYTLIGTFLISQYPYSIKVAWAPLVQASANRKAWLVPCFALGAAVLFWLGYHQDDLVSKTASGDTGSFAGVVLFWLTLTVLGATIRVALDDWSLELLSQANIHWVSTTVASAENIAAFFSFNVFLGLSSLGNPDAGVDGEATSTRLYFFLCAGAWVVVSLVVLCLPRSKRHTLAIPGEPGMEKTAIRTYYGLILQIVRLKNTWILMLVHLTSMIGFMCTDSIALLELVKDGFSDRDVAGLTTVGGVLAFGSGILVSRTYRRHHPLQVWRTLFPWRLATAVAMQGAILLVQVFSGSHVLRWCLALVPLVASMQFDSMMYISMVAFHAQIADPEHGGLYLPLLATTLNIRYDLLGLLVTKTIGWIDGAENLGVHPGNPNPDGSTGAAMPAATGRLIDGYQIVNLCSVLVALPVFWYFLRPATMWLQGTAREEWRLVCHKDLRSHAEYRPAAQDDEELEDL